MIHTIAVIRLGKKPKEIATKTGTPMTTAFGFADVEAENGLALSVIGFNDIATEILEYKKGDSLRFSGKLVMNT